MGLRSSLLAGTFGGTLLNVLAVLSLDEVLRTVLLGVIGAVVSFCMSLLLHCWFRRLKRKS